PTICGYDRGVSDIVSLQCVDAEPGSGCTFAASEDIDWRASPTVFRLVQPYLCQCHRGLRAALRCSNSQDRSRIDFAGGLCARGRLLWEQSSLKLSSR